MNSHVLLPLILAAMSERTPPIKYRILNKNKGKRKINHFLNLLQNRENKKLVALALMQ